MKKTTEQENTDELADVFSSCDIDSDSLVIIEPDFDDLMKEDEIEIPTQTFLEESNELLGNLDKITLEDYKKELRKWNRDFALLEPYDKLAFMRELRQIDVTIPSEEIYDFDALSEAYARITSYQARLTYMFGVVNTHVKTYKFAKECLGAMACGLTGKLKDLLMKAQAAKFTANITRELASHTVVLDHIEKWQDTIQTVGYNLNNLMRERENMSKINRNYVDRGNASAYGRANVNARGLHSRQLNENDEE